MSAAFFVVSSNVHKGRFQPFDLFGLSYVKIIIKSAVSALYLIGLVLWLILKGLNCIMLVSCKYCNAVHQRGYKCTSAPKAPTKTLNNSVRFRNSSAWKNKRAEIKARDNHLCQLCKADNRYTYDALDVHHISPLSESWHDRLDNNNLITLCKYHHFLADNGNIKRDALYKITNSAVTVFNTGTFEL